MHFTKTSKSELVAYWMYFGSFLFHMGAISQNDLSMEFRSCIPFLKMAIEMCYMRVWMWCND